MAVAILLIPGLLGDPVIPGGTIRRKRERLHVALSPGSLPFRRSGLRQLKRGLHLLICQHPQRHAACGRVLLLASPSVQARDEII